MRKISVLLLVVMLVFIGVNSVFAAVQHVLTPLKNIIDAPYKYEGMNVTVSCLYSGWKNAPGAPPISRSDWVVCDKNKNGIYCTGILPQDPETGENPVYMSPMNILAEVKVSADTKIPYLKILDYEMIVQEHDVMVSVLRVLLNSQQMLGDNVSIMGVLTKGYGIRGDRQYFIADPTGILRLGRLPKLLPKGTIVHVSGVVSEDENKMPCLEDIEILSYKLDCE